RIHASFPGRCAGPLSEAPLCETVSSRSIPVSPSPSAPMSSLSRHGALPICRALPRHGRGHWFDPSIAHGEFTFTVSSHADVAQLVAHHLAKVRVASSSLVIRSRYPPPCVEDHHIRRASRHGGMAEWLRQRSAKPSTRVRFPFPPLSSPPWLSLKAGAMSSAAEHFPDPDGVTGSIPVSRPVSSHADVAQLVAHHLAKVRVASSSLVIRSIFRRVISLMNDPPFSFRQYPAVSEASRTLRSRGLAESVFDLTVKCLRDIDIC